MFHLPSMRCVKSFSLKTRGVYSALYYFRQTVYLPARLRIFLKPKFASKQLVPGLLAVLRYVSLGNCGRLRQPNPSRAINRSPELEWLSTQVVLQRLARQKLLKCGYFRPLKEQSVHSENHEHQ